MGDVVGEAKGSLGGRALAVLACILALYPGLYGLAIVFDAPGRGDFDTGSKVVGVIIGLLGIGAAVLVARRARDVWRGEPRSGRKLAVAILLGFLWVFVLGVMYAVTSW